MPTLRKRSRALETPASPNHNNNNGEFISQSEKAVVSGYEESREKRIKENLERMQKLGIFDLSLKLKSCNPSNNRNYSVKKTPNGHSPNLQPLAPTRRSSRLQNVTPISYVKVHKSKKEGSLQDDDIVLEEGLRPEIYTEYYEKLLGDCKMSGKLFVDGYGKDRKRIYDSFRGKTCHQCRQKTLGHRTRCSQCNMIRGQFCGDCLFMRYGENVLEVKQNPNWICPVCRGICNCSLCRKAKGWAPTGCLYRKVSNLGFKSVAHYLIETRLGAPKNSGSNSGTKTPLSAKLSLPFLGMDASAEINDDAAIKVEENKKMHLLNNGDCYVSPGDSQENKESPSAIESSLDTVVGILRKRHTKDIYHDRKELKEETLAVRQAVNNITVGASVSERGSDLFTAKVNDDHLGLSVPQSEDRRNHASNGEVDVQYMIFNNDIKIELESLSRKRKLTSALEPSPDSVGGRLRQRHKEEKSHEGEEEDTINGEEKEKSHGRLHILYNCHGEIQMKSCSRKQKPTSVLEPNPDSIGGRLRKRRKEEKSHEGKELVVFPEETVVANKGIDIISRESEANSNVKLLDLTEPSADSITGRLRSRRKRA